MTETQPDRLKQLHHLLQDLHARAHVQESPFTSDTPLIGRAVVLFREAWKSVATKWYVRPLLHQQNRFNEAATLMLQEMLGAHIEFGQRLDEMNRRFDRIESALDQLEGRLISADRDTTLVARKLGEEEHRLREFVRASREGWAELADQVSRLEQMLADTDPPEPEQTGDSET
jgi:hypothetical protein